MHLLRRPLPRPARPANITQHGGINYPVVWADYEWTYQPETTNLGNAPYGWRLNHGSGGYAQFFGGQTYNSMYALMWRWSGGGGLRNGVGDFDQIDLNRLA